MSKPPDETQSKKLFKSFVPLHLQQTDSSHPIHTGICPECSYEFPPEDSPQIHWDCPKCGWIDDSV